VLATGSQFCAIVHAFDVTSVGTALSPGDATTWNVHITVSDSEKPSDADTAVIVPGGAAVVLTPAKETGGAVLLHETSEAL